MLPSSKRKSSSTSALSSRLKECAPLAEAKNFLARRPLHLLIHVLVVVSMLPPGIPIIFRPTMGIPKPGQPDKRRFIVNLSWESELTRRGLSDPVAPNSFTDQEYFEVAEWMSCSMCGEAIEIMREIGKLADPGLVPSESFARGGGGL